MYNHNDAMIQLMADQLAERHRTPKATVTHPKGVIVPDDALLTDNIRNDPDYVPYCGPCSPMQRMRRVEDGFVCPTCKNHTNWDLTHFNGNVDVKFDPEHMDDAAKQWVNIRNGVVAIERPTSLDSEYMGDDLIRAAHEHAASAAVKELLQRAELTNWHDDHGKKNTSYHDCNKCHFPFFGKRSRKYCRRCQVKITQVVKQNMGVSSLPFHMGSRQERRHG